MSILPRPNLPALSCLVGEDRAPLRIALVNLMPNKRQTETQFARVLSGHRRAVELTLVLPDCYEFNLIGADYLQRFYRRFSQIESNRFDAVIVTGAPVEKLAFEEVTYWAELKQLIRLGREHARSTFAVCWAGQAALNHFYGVPKHLSAEKYFGVFRHHVLRPDSPLVHGIVHDFPVPVSRHSEIGERICRGMRGFKSWLNSRRQACALWPIAHCI